MCLECRVILERYDKAATRLQESLIALRGVVGTPQFNFVNQQVSEIDDECREVRVALDQHRAYDH